MIKSPTARIDDGLAFIHLMVGIAIAVLVACGPLIPSRESPGVSVADLQAGNYRCATGMAGCIPLKR